jgi:N-acetylglucosamine kinase-like BadF-type ATPase
MTRTAITKSTRPSRHGMLGIYLNDHLAGATAGSELARRMARSHQEREEAAILKRLAAEIARCPCPCIPAESGRG